MFDAHPPFQIDGNLGGTAGIAEMLLQSHCSAIELIPSLPDAWAKGSFQGLVARGNFEISAAWTEKSVTCATIHSRAGGECRLIWEKEAPVLTDSKGNPVSYSLENSILTFPTVLGEIYTLQAI